MYKFSKFIYYYKWLKNFDQNDIQFLGDQLYAAKIIKTDGSFNGHDQMIFIRESLILQKLNHPNNHFKIPHNFHHR